MQLPHQVEHAARRLDRTRNRTYRHRPLFSPVETVRQSVRAPGGRSGQGSILLPLGRLAILPRAAIAPMGETLKREAGERLPAGLKSPESMGICFLRGENYREFLRRRAPNGIRPGEIVDRNGKRIGTHDGCAFYTVGQKRGLGLPLRWPSWPSTPPESADRRRRRGIAAAPSDSPLHERPDMERLCRSRELRVVIRGIGRNPDGFARVRLERDRLHVELEYPAMGTCTRTAGRLLRTGHRAGRRHSGGQRIDRPAHFSHKGNGTGFPTDENMCTRTPGQVLDARRVATRTKGRTAECPECAKNGALFYLPYQLSSLFP